MNSKDAPPQLRSPPASPPAPPPSACGSSHAGPGGKPPVPLAPLELPRPRNVRRMTRRSLRAEMRSRARSLFLLDWDNTLLPTNMLRVCRCLTASGDVVKACPPPDMVRADLAALEGHVCGLLDSIRQLPSAEVAIVTNASEGWVQSSSAKFLPRVADYIAEHNINVRSARTATAEAMGGSPAEWKATIFTQELAPLRWPVSLWAPHDAYDGAGSQAVRIISIGDSEYERTAAAAVAHHDDIVVTVKLAANPTCRQLCQQLRTVRSSLPKLHAMDKCVAINAVPQKKQKQKQKQKQTPRQHQVAAGRLAPVIEHPEQAVDTVPSCAIEERPQQQRGVVQLGLAKQRSIAVPLDAC